MFIIDVDLKIEADLLKRARRVSGAVENGLLRVGQHAQQIALRETGKIYARPVPRRKKSRAPMWNRSGDLLASIGVTLDARSASLALSVSAPYANRRHGLGVDWQPRAPALGMIRRNPFLSDARARLEPQAAALFADGVNEVMDA